MRVKNWRKFQHFKDRSPPWIKLYRDLLDDLDWHELPPQSAKALVMIWLIASENGGELPDLKTLAFRLRLKEDQTKSIISSLSHWLEQGDITPISEGPQSDSTEGEGETEKEVEKEREARKRAEVPCPADWIPVQTWTDFVEHRKNKRAKLTPRAVELIVRELEGFRAKGVAPVAVLEYAIKNGHTGLYYKPDAAAKAKPDFGPAQYKCSRCGDGCGNGLKHKGNNYCQSCYSHLKAEERGAELIAKNIADAAKRAA